jgi:hypothetical protein
VSFFNQSAKGLGLVIQTQEAQTAILNILIKHAKTIAEKCVSIILRTTIKYFISTKKT